MDFSNLDNIENSISEMFFSNQRCDDQLNISPSPEAQIAIRWLDAHNDDVTSLEMKWISDLNTCMTRVREYIRDFGTEKVIYV